MTAEPLAVIDIGSTAIRMTIAAVDKAGMLRRIESLQQSVSIGKDTFRKGFIEKATIEESVRALRNFGRVLREYGFENGERVRVVATTAVREASNSEAFCDRIHIACGWRVEVLHLADIAWLTYLGVRPFFDKKESKADLLIVEMGGGGTEACFIGRGRGAAFSQTFPAGSLRLRQLLEDARITLADRHPLIEETVRRPIERIAALLAGRKIFMLVALGGDMRFAAANLLSGWDGVSPAVVPLARLVSYMEKTAALPLEKLVKKERLSFAEAETLGPALFFYVRLAQRLRRSRLHVAGASMRDGILLQMAGYGKGDDRFRENILGSAEAVARKYQADLGHSHHVLRLAGQLFLALAPEHRLKAHDGMLLLVAALVHDIGLFIGPRNHHKHSMYLIRNSEIFGLNDRDIGLVSLIARYHRRSPPKQSHQEFMGLDFEDRIRVAKLAAVLRVADALDQSHTGRIGKITIKIDGDRLLLTAEEGHDVSLEEAALRNKGSLFEDVYGLRPVLRPGSAL